MDYTITTTEEQEQGLKFTYDSYADKTVFPTQAEFLQWRVENQVLNPMYVGLQNSVAANFDASFQTIPQENRATATQGIKDVITTNGGTIVTTVPPTPLSSIFIPPPLQRRG